MSRGNFVFKIFNAIFSVAQLGNFRVCLSFKFNISFLCLFCSRLVLRIEIGMKRERERVEIGKSSCGCIFCFIFINLVKAVSEKYTREPQNGASIWLPSELYLQHKQMLIRTLFGWRTWNGGQILLIWKCTTMQFVSAIGTHTKESTPNWMLESRWWKSHLNRIVP